LVIYSLELSPLRSVAITEPPLNRELCNFHLSNRFTRKKIKNL